MKILGVIPARGGSKGIPRKNLIELHGQPLLMYTAEAATHSKLERTVLSTDDEEIASVGQKLGLEIPFMRPDELAQDDTLIIDVLKDLISKLEEKPDAICLLQPTSPLRNHEHIDEALELFHKHDTETVVSVVEVPHQFASASLMNEEGEFVEHAETDPVLRRQDKKKSYARNGPAILITKTSLIEEGKLYGEKIRPYVMKEEDSIDIDTAEDLTRAEEILEGRKR